MEPVSMSETPVSFYHTARRNIPGVVPSFSMSDTACGAVTSHSSRKRPGSSWCYSGQGIKVIPALTRATEARLVTDSKYQISDTSTTNVQTVFPVCYIKITTKIKFYFSIVLFGCETWSRTRKEDDFGLFSCVWERGAVQNIWT
jgi:hypothetical protein